ncbi:hypothetical protein [Sinomonas sp. G460-2]|uniref:hypothetical protein n=1 Tax=Sinomonas sp. G460-2 TaxID=3393464 RepID=UPI0039F135F2
MSALGFLSSREDFSSAAPTATPQRASTAVPPWAAESAGFVLALTLALLAVWHVDATDRSWLLYYDGDSVLPALVRQSVLAGQPQDWSLSAVLFIPEMGLYFALAGLGLGVKGTFALSAVVNLLLLYGVLRVLAGAVHRGRPRSLRVAGALVAFGAMASLTLLEDSPRQETFELASLVVTTTYYSMTLLGAVAATGIVARLVTAQRGGRRRWLEPVLMVTSALSALTNPLFLAWATMPLILVLALVARRRVVGWRGAVRVGVLLVLGSGLGVAARIAFTPLFSKYGPTYSSPGLSWWSAVYYLGAWADRASTVAGAVSLTVAVALMLVSVIVFRRSLVARDAAAAIVSGMGWVAPVGLLVGGICLGTFAIRYLQPMVFAPVCMLVLAPRLAGQGRTFRGRLDGGKARAIVSGLMVVALGVSALATGALSRSAAVVDPDIVCVDAWIAASHRTGAGGFWTIRGPKAYLGEPDQLVQVDQTFGAYPWLSDRTDYANAKVSFVLTDNAHPAPVLPPVARTAPQSTVQCGRYTITDFGTALLPIGPASPNPLA